MFSAARFSKGQRTEEEKATAHIFLFLFNYICSARRRKKKLHTENCIIQWANFQPRWTTLLRKKWNWLRSQSTHWAYFPKKSLSFIGTTKKAKQRMNQRKHLASLTHQLKTTHFSTDLAHCGTASRKAYLPNALLSKLSFLQDSHIFCLFHMRWAAAAAAATYCITFNFLSSAFELLLSSCTTRIAQLGVRNKL